MTGTDPAVDALAALLSQTPPGQVAKVYHDLRVLLDASAGPGASDQLRAAAWPVLGTYNTQQLITVKTPAAADAPDAAPAQPLIISPAGAIIDETAPEGAVRFVDPRAQTTYAFDPLRLRLSDPQPIAIHSAYDQLRHALDAAAARYASHHYQDGVTSAFVQVAPEAQAQEVTPTESADQASAAVDATVAADASSGDGSLAQGLMPPASLEHETPDHGVDSAAELQTHSAASAAPDTVYERLDAEQAEDQPHEAKEDALLSDEMEKTHLSTEPLEPELQTEKADQGAPEAGPTGDEYESKPDSAASAKSWVPASAPTFALYIVGNRYNLANYWAGRWRSTYTFCLPSAADTGAGEAGDSIQVQGKVQVQVHYFEDGNVQLLAEHAPKLSVSTSVNVAAVLSGSASPKDYTLLAEDIVRTIKADEQAYHAALEATLSELAERTFRALRRQLPVTKQKLDWNRAVSYNLASDLGR